MCVCMCVFSSWSRLRVLIFSTRATDIYLVQTVCWWVRVKEEALHRERSGFKWVGEGWFCFMQCSWNTDQMLNEKCSVALITTVHETTVPVPQASHYTTLYCGARKRQKQTGVLADQTGVLADQGLSRFMCIIQFGYIFKSSAKFKLPEPLWAIDSHQRKLCLFYSLDFNRTLTLAALTLKAVTFRPPKCLTLISYWACASCKNESKIKQWKYDSYESPASSYNCSCQAIKDHGVYCIAANTVSRNWRTNHWRVIAPVF